MNRLLHADALAARLPGWLRFALAALLLCGTLLAMVQSRAGILRSGTEIRLRTAPVDPRDLFRGDYVVLAYDISTIDLAAVQAQGEFRRGESVHVAVAPGADGFARVVALGRERPAGTGTVLNGRVTATNACRAGPDGQPDCSRPRGALRVAYGIESYFVPQGQGRAIETTARSRIEVVVAVSASGEAAIKRLLIDGKLVHAEPPY